MPPIPPRAPRPTRPARKPAPARPVSDWLEGETTFRSLAARVDRLVALQASLVAACPRVPLTVVSLEGDTLTVRTANAAWAARLRQMTPTLLGVIHRDCAQVSRIRITPQRSTDSAFTRVSAPRAAVPAQALREFERIGGGLEDSALEQALAKLVRRQRGGR